MRFKIWAWDEEERKFFSTGEVLRGSRKAAFARLQELEKSTGVHHSLQVVVRESWGERNAKLVLAAACALVALSASAITWLHLIP